MSGEQLTYCQRCDAMSSGMAATGMFKTCYALKTQEALTIFQREITATELKAVYGVPNQHQADCSYHSEQG